MISTTSDTLPSGDTEILTEASINRRERRVLEEYDEPDIDTPWFNLDSTATLTNGATLAEIRERVIIRCQREQDAPASGG